MHEFAHYLEAKRTVDDRALNRVVLERLRHELEGVDAPADPADPAIADIGAGIGTGIERLLDWKIVRNPKYTAVDESSVNIVTARSRLEGRVEAELVVSTLADFTADNWNLARFDLVIAHAFLDIVALAPALKNLVALTRPGGLLYFPITFDGETVFEPAHDADDAILSSYHESMNDPGDSRTGRHLFHALSREPVDILEMGSSDWIVRPDSGGYPADEAFFLEFVIGMVEKTLGETSERWVAERRRQIKEGQLLYIAHQIDCLARKRG